MVPRVHALMTGDQARTINFLLIVIIAVLQNIILPQFYILPLALDPFE
jgi:hypothetical protein